MPRHSMKHNETSYKVLRIKNNKSVQRSREKSRCERNKKIRLMQQLEDDNQNLMRSLDKIKEEYEQLQNLFKTHIGIDIDPVPMANKQINESPPTPALTINTIENRYSSNNQFNANDLHGSTVIINGVQYKIVNMSSTS